MLDLIKCFLHLLHFQAASFWKNLLLAHSHWSHFHNRHGSELSPLHNLQELFLLMKIGQSYVFDLPKGVLVAWRGFSKGRGSFPEVFEWKGVLWSSKHKSIFDYFIILFEMGFLNWLLISFQNSGQKNMRSHFKLPSISIHKSIPNSAIIPQNLYWKLRWKILAYEPLSIIIFTF